jgi:hypothetical protein
MSPLRTQVEAPPPAGTKKRSSRNKPANIEVGDTTALSGTDKEGAHRYGYNYAYTAMCLDYEYYYMLNYYYRLNFPDYMLNFPYDIR